MKRWIGVLYGLTVSVALLAVQPDSLRLDSAQQALLDSLDRMFTLQEVVVTAEEMTGRSSASVINKEAMQHLQPSSFTDITNMLPGAAIKDPKLTTSNTIHLREAGDGSSDENYATSSLGTGFIIDGAPVSTDANMQYIQSGSSQDEARQTVNKGVDMRTISTDDIEKVEIIRGIANAEYGDITSGVVKIERSMKPTPWKARFKADGFSKLVYVGKGVGWNDDRTVLYAGLDYLNAKSDPTNTLENYQRINASIRLQQRWSVDDYTIRWQSNADYSGNIDADKNDPDIHHNREDSYRSEWHKIAWSNTLNWTDRNRTWWSASLLANISGEISTIQQTKFIQLSSPKQLAFDNTEEGNYTASFLPPSYVSNYRVEGRPLSVYIRPKASFTGKTWVLDHKADIGIEWKYDKNFGKGQIYDLRRPLSATSNLRPRAYYDIPATNKLSWFIQDDIHIPVLTHSFDLSVGLRGSSLLGLDQAYVMHGKCYLDPRVNLSYNLPVKGGQLIFSAGYGIHTKMPTLLQLYPNLLYEDLTAPDDYTRPEDETKQIYTHVINPTNHALQPARNDKWEVRFGFDIHKHKFSVTYFEEGMKNGFRSRKEVVGYPYHIDGEVLLNDYTKLIDYPVTINGSAVNKRGVEWQYQSPRIPAICTRFTINGAWLHTEYRSTDPFVFAPAQKADIDQTTKVAIKEQYMGLYNWNDLTIRENLNTNIIADVYIKKIGLTVSATFELSFYTLHQTAWRDSVPTQYIDAQTNTLHPYTPQMQTDEVLSKLIYHTNDYTFRNKIPFAGYLNLRVQKTVTKYATISLYVNKLLDYLPSYTKDGQVIRRNASPYFGMEVNLTI